MLAAIITEAQQWRTSRHAAVWHLTLPLVLLFTGAAIWYLNRELMRLLVAEDGIFEWLQVAGFAIAAVLAIHITLSLHKAKHHLVAWLFAILALGLVFIVGEELAWGQRLFGFQTPAELAAINEKQEISFHNIESVTQLFTFAKLLAGLYGTFGAWLLLRLRAQPWSEQFVLVVVPAFLSMPFAIVLGMRLLRLTVMTGDVPLGFAELEELILSYGMASFVTMVWLRLRVETNAQQASSEIRT